MTIASSGKLPRFSLVVPNLLHDGPNSSPDCDGGDKLECSAGWLKEKFDGLISAEGFGRDVVLIVTFDENGDEWPYLNRRDNNVYAVILGGGTKVSRITSVYTHYDLLRTVESILGVKPMASGDRCAHVMAEAWK